MLVFVVFAIAFFLERILNIYINFNIAEGIFISASFVVSSIALLPLITDDIDYWYVLVTFGVIYDLVYASTYFMYILIFLILGGFVKLFYYYVPENILTINILGLIIIFMIHILVSLIFAIINYLPFYMEKIIRMFLSSTILNVLYITVSYLILKKVLKKAH